MLVGYAGAGAAIGGILGAMSFPGLGVSEDEAHHYEKLFTEGKAIVAVKAPRPSPPTSSPGTAATTCSKPPKAPSKPAVYSISHERRRSGRDG